MKRFIVFLRHKFCMNSKLDRKNVGKYVGQRQSFSSICLLFIGNSGDSLYFLKLSIWIVNVCPLINFELYSSQIFQLTKYHHRYKKSTQKKKNCQIKVFHFISFLASIQIEIYCRLIYLSTLFLSLFWMVGKTKKTRCEMKHKYSKWTFIF